MKKLLVFDMDGTLLNSQKAITSMTKKAINEAQEKGMVIALASGRHCTNLAKYVEQLELVRYPSYCIGNNGQELLNLQTKELIRGNQIPFDVVKIACQFASQEDREMYACVYGDTFFRTTKHAVKYSPEHQLIGYDYEKEAFEYQGDMDKIGFFVPKERNDAFDLAKRLNEQIKGKAQAIVTNDVAVEIVPEGIDKYLGIDLICENLGFALEDVLVFGDGLNDFGMMKKYPSCAMGNAYQEIKDVANYVVPSNDEEGIAFGIKHYAY
ncbi:MAG: Cof-type HAD-IIB family hydrolase [Erysipelotrichaceae bacterium]|nr:Cof-type HAD-IIB family hydrolase [Erysipelotrichaceae bacterium]